ncbi:uncharacterized protein LOC125048927 [Pieris napi]|uniref:uncharacterized protein LOC125048927 n=1 Tax=Pieris napi TaxID=78633 RepID=UPI001FBA9ED1|nr:uncharacterized protein LOC125048927 [Pieris napi]
MPNPRTLQIIRNLKQDNEDIIHLEPKTSTSIQFTKKEQFIQSPKGKDNIENKNLSNVSEDFCSDDSVKDPDYVDIDTSCSTKRSLLRNERQVFKNLMSRIDLNEKQYDNFSDDVSTKNQTSSPIPMPIAPMQTESNRSSSDSSSSSSGGSSSSDSETSLDDELNNERLTAVVQSRVNIFPTIANCIEDSRYDSIEPVPSTSRSTANTPPSSLVLSSNTNSTQYIDCEDNTNSNKGRKRKSTPNNWLRNKAKILRNSGKSYISNSKKGKTVVPAKSLKTPCTDKCKQKCTQNITESQRKEIFECFWGMGDLQRQRDFILRHLSVIEPRYSYKMHNSNRGKNNAFYLTVYNERIRVCKVFFKATLDITDTSIRTVLQKKKNSCGMLDLDNRGKHSQHVHLDPAIREGIIGHINSIPKINSHYCRADTKRLYIDGGKTVADLHRDYELDCQSKNLPSANYLMYYRIFNKEFNIAFFQPKKDQCEDCTSYSNATENDKVELKEKFDRHLTEKDLSRQNKEDDKKFTPDNCIVLVYDLQAAMPCPRGDASNFYYVSKLNTYNFTICDIKSKDTACYVWHEGEAKRGATEIGSCLLKYIQNLKLKAEELDSKLDIIFYSDNCCGQQKNQYIIALYVYAVYHLDFINSITHKYLIKGHTQNEGDNVHSLIERGVGKALKSGPIYTPDQYVHIIRNAKKTGKAYQVNELEHEDFFDIKALASSIGKNFSKNMDKETLKLGDVKILKVESNDFNYCFSYKTSYEDTQFKTVIIDKIGKTRNTANNITVKKAYKEKIPICEKKKKGLLDLIRKNIVPRFYKPFFENL